MPSQIAPSGSAPSVQATPGNIFLVSRHQKHRQECTHLTIAKKTLTNGMSELEAIDRAKQGDAACFEGLYGLHKRRVYSLCLRMTGNTAEAEDLTQEAFLQLFRKISTFRGESAFSTW